MTHTFKNAELRSVFLRQQRPQQPARPLEDTWQTTSKWSYASVKKNLDQIGFFAIYLLSVAGALIFAVVHYGAVFQASNAIEIVFGAAVIGAFLELARRIYDTAVKRLAIIDLFTSEMFNILRTFAAANIIGEFVRLYDIIDAEAPAAGGAAVGAPSAAGMARGAGSENYFDIFQSSSADLGLLDPAAINDITAFYTFLKAARDATGAFKSWSEPRYSAAVKKENVVNIVYLCFLMTVHGVLALERIVVSRDNWYLIEDILAGVLLQTFAFLDHVVPDDDFRRPRIEQRRERCAELQQQYFYEFGPAKSLLGPTRATA